MQFSIIIDCKLYNSPISFGIRDNVSLFFITIFLMFLKLLISFGIDLSYEYFIVRISFLIISIKCFFNNVYHSFILFDGT